LRTGLAAHRLTRERRGLRTRLLTGRTQRRGLNILTWTALNATLSTGRHLHAGLLHP
jgi:hypothetical protein